MPRNTQVKPAVSSENYQPPERTIEPSSTFLKALIAIVQLGASIMTLYRARGDQINKYGLPAFGLAVVPYAVMSLLNLVGTLMLPEYPALYLVESEIMHEATSRGSHFGCVVGRVKPDDQIFHVTGGKQIRGRFEVQSGEEVPSHPDSDISEAQRPSETEENEVETGSLGDENGISESEQQGMLEGNLEPSTAPQRRVFLSFAQPRVSADDTSTMLQTKYHISLPSWKEIMDTLVQKGDASSLAEASAKQNDALEPTVFIPSCPPFARNHSIKYKASLSMQKQAYNGVFKFGNTPTWPDPKWYTVLASVFAGLVSIGIMAGLSCFRFGESTRGEVAVTIIWLVLGIYLGQGFALWDNEDESSYRRRGGGVIRSAVVVRNICECMLILIFSSPAVAGFVQVGMMMSRYGMCTRIY